MGAGHEREWEQEREWTFPMGTGTTSHGCVDRDGPRQTDVSKRETDTVRWMCRTKKLTASDGDIGQGWTTSDGIIGQGQVSLDERHRDRGTEATEKMEETEETEEKEETEETEETETRLIFRIE